METMKKIGLLLLALVIALGALGVGYAKWTDTVTINGTVNTGTLILGVKDIGTNDAKGTLDTLCAPVPGVAVGQERKDVGSFDSANGTVKAGCDGYYADITETLTNVYPGYYGESTIELKNCGTVPLKIEDIQLTNPSGTDLTSWMLFKWSVTDENGVPHGTYSGNIQALETALLGQQIAGGKTVNFVIGICFQEYNGQQEIMPQKANMGFSVVFTGSQWNEVAATPVYPSN
jgi:predicted ribosomally synthesized peptide with SipW-like signal peptide